MKKKEIISICKKNNYLYRGIYDGVQWIGTGQAAYPLFDLPIMTDGQLLTFLDVEENKREKYAFYDKSDKITKLLDDLEERGREIIFKNIGLSLGDRKVQVYATTDGNDFIFIDPALLKPFKDISDGYSLYVRYPTPLSPVVIVKKGMLPIGLIFPITISENYADVICEMSAFFCTRRETL